MIRNPDEWEDVKDQAAETLEELLLLRDSVGSGDRITELETALRLCNDELAKAYEHGAQYQEQAAALAARVFDDGK